MDKKLLYISAHFPPCAASGVFRTLGFIKNLVNYNWHISVLSIKNISEERFDPKLLKEVPENVEILRTGYFDPFFFKIKVTKSAYSILGQNDSSSKKIFQKNDIKRSFSLIDSFSYLLKTPDSYVGWIPLALIKSIFLIKRPDIITATAPPFSSLILGVILKKIWNVPLVTDFRDPWTGNPFRVQRPMFSHRLDKILEKKVIINSDKIILNTDETKNLYCSLYPDFTNKMVVITNGFDERYLEITPRQKPEKNKLWIVHVGSLYGTRSPKELAEAVSSLNSKDVRIDFYGSHTEDYSFKKSKTINFHGSISHDKAISTLKGADIVLVFGNCASSSTQIPAKLFEALGVGKNIWLIDTPNSPSHNILKRYNIPHFFSENKKVNIQKTLSNIISVWRSGNLNKDFFINSLIDRFNRTNLTARLEYLLNELITKSKVVNRPLCS